MAKSLEQVEVMVTGATGLIGRWLLASLTRQGAIVGALVRDAHTRAGELATFVARLGGDPSRIVALDGDVERADLGLAAALPNVQVVHHLAARFAFGLSRADAHRTNVDGTRHVMRWARALPRLRRFVFLGGYRMTKVDLSRLDARALDDLYAAGAYEASKVEAYAVFRALAAELALPWTAVHPSGLIGDSRTGETTQLVGLGDTVQRLYERGLPALAGTARTFVPVVTVDYLADFLASVPRRAESADKDLVVFDPASPPLPELVRRLAGVLGVPAPTRAVPVGLVARLPRAWTGLHRESTRFLVEDRYDTRDGDAHAAAVGLAHPPLDRALARWASFLVSTRFLARPDAPRGQLVDGTYCVGDPARAAAVLLHGLPFDADAMAPLADAMAPISGELGEVARVDLPGLGRSGRGPLAPRWLADLLAARTEPVVLIGHSLGAALAVQYAAAHPDRVAALVLVAPAFLARPASWTLRLSPVVACALRGLRAATFEHRFLAEAAAGSAHDATTSALAALARAGAPRRYAAALATALASRESALAAYATARTHGIPAIVIHAASEPPIEDLRGAARAVIEGAGHNPQLTHTDEVARATRRFLAERAATISITQNTHSIAREPDYTSRACR